MEKKNYDKIHPETAVSPFHSGEHEIQARVGKRDKIESFGQQAIRSYMPEQHRKFYQQLSFIIVGSVDKQGWPWASVISGAPGFITSPDATTLTINATVLAGNPIAPQLKKGGSPLGLLGIDMSSRRRNRVNGHVNQVSSTHFSMSVDQSFGNCSKYIHTRNMQYNKKASIKESAHHTEKFSVLDNKMKGIICLADTFFVSSYVQANHYPEREGVDVSHRGGQPGFVTVDGNTLTIPDYTGNHYFNTLGNFLVNPKAGLVFINFVTGDLLMLTGAVDVLWENAPEVTALKGAKRAWRFILDHGFILKKALPFRVSFNEYSRDTLMTDD